MLRGGTFLASILNKKCYTCPTWNTFRKASNQKMVYEQDFHSDTRLSYKH